MGLALVLFALSLVVSFLLRNKISQGAKDTIKLYRSRYEDAVAEHKRLNDEHKNLKRELASLKNARAMANAQETVERTPPQGEDKKTVEDFLLSQGMMSLEQHQNALKGVETLGMDYLNVCLTLGFITKAQAELAQKAVG